MGVPDFGSPPGSGETLRTQGADAVDEALTRREREQYYEYFEYFTPRAVRVNEAFRDHGVDYDE